MGIKKSELTLFERSESVKLKNKAIIMLRDRSNRPFAKKKNSESPLFRNIDTNLINSSKFSIRLDEQVAEDFSKLILWSFVHKTKINAHFKFHKFFCLFTSLSHFYWGHIVNGSEVVTFYVCVSL